VSLKLPEAGGREYCRMKKAGAFLLEFQLGVRSTVREGAWA